MCATGNEPNFYDSASVHAAAKAARFLRTRYGDCFECLVRAWAGADGAWSARDWTSAGMHLHNPGVDVYIHTDDLSVAQMDSGAVRRWV